MILTGGMMPDRATRRLERATRSEVLGEVTGAVERLARLVAGSDLTARVPDSPAWTVREAYSHVVTVIPRYARGPSGSGRWVPDARDLPALNAVELEAVRDADLAQLTDRMRSDLTALTNQIEGYGDQQPVYRFHGGASVAADVALGILLGEVLIHGRDIARAVHRPWPISARQAALVLDGVVPILPGWVDPTRAAGLTAAFDIRVHGCAPHLWSFTDGRLTIDPDVRSRPDVHVAAAPVAFLLLCYRRIPHLRAIASGQLLAWGRRPWLAPTLVGRFLLP